MEDFQNINIFSIYANNFYGAGQVSVLRYFNVCGTVWGLIYIWGFSVEVYADDLVIIADSLEEYVRKLLTWKEATEDKGLRVNTGKTKVMICGTGLILLLSSSGFQYAVCSIGEGNSSIYCNGCKLGEKEMMRAPSSNV